jgi:hypothetical protein
VDRVAPEELDEEEHEAHGDPGRQALGDVPNRAGPAGADDHQGAGEHEAAQSERREVDEVDVEGAPGGVGVGQQPGDERDHPDRDQQPAASSQRRGEVARIRPHHAARVHHSSTPG